MLKIFRHLFYYYNQQRFSTHLHGTLIYFHFKLRWLKHNVHVKSTYMWKDTIYYKKLDIYNVFYVVFWSIYFDRKYLISKPLNHCYRLRFMIVKPKCASIRRSVSTSNFQYLVSFDDLPTSEAVGYVHARLILRGI